MDVERILKIVFGVSVCSEIGAMIFLYLDNTISYAVLIFAGLGTLGIFASLAFLFIKKEMDTMDEKDNINQPHNQPQHKPHNTQVSGAQGEYIIINGQAYKLQKIVNQTERPEPEVPVESGFDESYAETVGAPSEDTEPPDFKKYFDDEPKKQETLYERNERIKRMYYTRPESHHITVPERQNVLVPKPQPVTIPQPYHASPDLIPQGEPNAVPLVDPGTDAGLSRFPAKDVGVPQPHIHGSLTPTSRLDIDWNLPPEDPDAIPVNRLYYEQYFESVGADGQPIRIIKYMTVKANKQFNDLKRKSNTPQKPGGLLSRILLKPKQDTPATPTFAAGMPRVSNLSNQKKIDELMKKR